VRLAYNEKTERLIYEVTETAETLRTTYLYDDFGNITEQRDYGALSIEGDEAFTFTEYINDLNLWIIGLPKRHYVTDAGAQQFSETLSYYDGLDYEGLASGQVSRGNLTRQRRWVEDTSYIDVVRSAYDPYGNIVGTRDGNGNQRTITYDDTLHTYPVQEDIEVGDGKPDLSLAAAYNLGLGMVTSSIDFNGHQTGYGHDRFGRLTSLVRPGDSASLPTLAFSYSMTDPEQGLIYSYDAEGALTLTTGPPLPSSVDTGGALQWKGDRAFLLPAL
jgi:YD repeat-containing protein